MSTKSRYLHGASSAALDNKNKMLLTSSTNTSSIPSIVCSIVQYYANFRMGPFLSPVFANHLTRTTKQAKRAITITKSSACLHVLIAMFANKAKVGESGWNNRPDVLHGRAAPPPPFFITRMFRHWQFLTYGVGGAVRCGKKIDHTERGSCPLPRRCCWLVSGWLAGMMPMMTLRESKIATNGLLRARLAEQCQS